MMSPLLVYITLFLQSCLVYSYKQTTKNEIPPPHAYVERQHSLQVSPYNPSMLVYPPFLRGQIQSD
jgi:hypothetical protein